MVEVTVTSGLNTEQTAYDSKFDSKFLVSSYYCYVILLHIRIGNSKIFTTVFLKHITVCIKCNSYVGMTEKILQYLCRHT